jgi:hypothetical protein
VDVPPPLAPWKDALSVVSPEVATSLGSWLTRLAAMVGPLRTRTLEMDGLPFLQKWALPNFYFHVTAAYALLRGAGVEVGKQDFLGGV